MPTGRDRVIEPLGEQHARLRASFSCGVEALDRYLHRQATQDVRRRVAVVWVMHDRAAHTLAGYYSLSATSIELKDLPTEVSRRLPRYPLVPAILLGRLASDLRYRGPGIGEALLTNALRRAVQLSSQLGIVAVVVEAKDEPITRFYERYEFSRFPHESRRLYVTIQDIAASLDNLPPAH